MQSYDPAELETSASALSSTQVGGSSHHCLPLPSRKRWRCYQPASLALVTILGLTGGVWLTTATLVAPIAHAYTNRATITLDRQPGETYQTLLRRAEAAARAATQQTFDRDLLVTDVSVTIVAETDEGLIAPVLALAVSRTEWRRLPDPQRWSTYFENARVLLRLDQPTATGGQAAPIPVSAPVPSLPNVDAAPVVAPTP